MLSSQEKIKNKKIIHTLDVFFLLSILEKKIKKQKEKWMFGSNEYLLFPFSHAMGTILFLGEVSL